MLLCLIGLQDSVTLEEIDSAESLARNLERIELPTQLVAVLADPLLQKFLLLRPGAEASSRITNWLTACLDDVARGDADPAYLEDILEVIHDYAVSAKVSEHVRLTEIRQLAHSSGRHYRHYYSLSSSGI
jgi:centromere protein I